MNYNLSRRFLCGLFALCTALLLRVAVADTTVTPPFSEVHTIASSGSPAPVEHDFNIPASGTYQVVLTDLGAELSTPAPLASVTLAVTNGTALVGKALSGAGTLQFTATGAGVYSVHVVGTPGSTAGSGPIGLKIGTAANPTSVAEFSDNIAVPSGSTSSGTALIDDTLTVTTSGSYTLSLADLGLPQALTEVTLALTVEGGSIVQVLPDSNNNNSLQATVQLSAGTTYRIVAVGVANSSVEAGLYSATVVSSGGGTPVYSKAVPVGATTLVGTPTLTAESQTLTLTDLAYPAALSQLGAAIVLNGQSAASTLTAAGTRTFTASAASYQIFAVATPQTASPSAGAYSLQLVASGASSPSLSVARAVTGSSSGLSAYSFDSSLSASGSYAITLTDFSFPLALNSARLAAVQNGALLGTPLSAAGTLTATAQSGAITYLVIAQPDTSRGGTFDVSVTSSGSSTLLFDATQGAGAAFISRAVTISTATTYGITASDLGFPASFSNFAMLVSQGPNNLGSTLSVGSVSLVATAGTYYINLIAQPSSKAGTYALVMGATPTVTLSASTTSVSSGSTVTLTWSSQDATSCTASGGWSGTQATSGTAQTSAITADTTFTLSCTGVGGTTSKSVTVSVQTSSKGGGGALDVGILAALGFLTAHAYRRRSRR